MGGRTDDEWLELLADAARTGEPLTLIPEDAPEGSALRDPARADEWTDERRLPAAVLRTAVLALNAPGAQPDTRGLRVVGADVTGLLDLSFAHLPVPLLLEACRLAQSADLRQVMAPTLDFEGSCIGAPSGGTALDLNSARIDGGVFLNDAHVTGVLWANGAHIGGQLNLTGAHLTNPTAQTNPDAHALNLNSARIDGGVFLNDAHVTGVLWANEAHIGGQLNLTGAHLTNPTAQTNPDAKALNLEGARIDGGVFLRGVTSIHGKVSLTASTMGSLVVGTGPGAECRPQAPLEANGWTVGDLYGWVRTDRREAARWLDRRPKGQAFAPQPWRELAAVYERNGHPAEAKRLRASAAWRTTKTAPWTAKPGRLLYGALVGYGYYPLLTAVWLLATLLVAWMVVSTNADTFVMTGSEITPYPPLEPFAYAIETVIPPAAALAESPWAPPSGSGAYYGLIALSISGWILSVLFLAGISGILRKT